MVQNLNKKRSVSSKSLTDYIRKVVIFSTLLMTIFVATVISIHEILIFRDISEQQQSAHLEEHKEFVRDLINIEIEYIASQKKLFDERTIESVKQNVCSAHSIAEKIYTTYHGKIEEQVLIKLIVDAISSLKCTSPYMHVFINDMNGNGVYYQGRPEYHGENLLQHTDMNGNRVVESEIELLKKQDEGYVRYMDNNQIVGSDSLPQNKVVFVKKFKILNWYFGSKTYLEDYYEEFKHEVARKISSDHFRYGGYVFVNEMDGDPIVMNGKAYQGDFNLLNGTDSAKTAVFRQELDAALSSTEGNFFVYNWNKIGEDKISPKISFVKLFPECNWLVGAGFYLDEIWSEMGTHKQQLKHDLIKNLIVIFIVLLLVILVELFILYRFNNYYLNDFNNFTRFFNVGKEGYKTINVDNLYFDEFKNMGEVANEMIIERKKVHKQLIREQEKAQEADRLKTAFLANMSHEIRTPMNAILGFSSLLDEEDTSSEEKQVYIQLIHKNGAFLLKLINDIVDISKIESDQLTIVKEEFLLGELIDEIKWHYKDLVTSQYNSKIVFELENQLPQNYVCRTDKYRLKQVIDNLLGNAIKFTQSGSVKLTVSKRGDWLHFSVVDTGIGVSPADIKNIFKRFIQARTESKKTYGGTGLGLAISQKIVHLMGGDIGVKSNPGKGSDFYFYIPV